MNQLLEARTQLANLLTYMDGKTGAEEIIMKAIKDLGTAPCTCQRAEACRGSVIMTDTTVREGAPNLGATEETSEFASLLMQEFKPKTERAREAVETAVRTLAEQALAQTDLRVQ